MFASFPDDNKGVASAVMKNESVNYIRSIEYLRAKDIIMMQLVADGYTAAQIAEEMGLKKRTVEHRVMRLRKKMNSKSITHLAVLLLRANVIK